MRLCDAVAHFGSRAALAKALGVTKGAISQWGSKVPELRAYQIQTLTGGKLKVDEPEQPQAA